jgi:hypothetical protein
MPDRRHAQTDDKKRHGLAEDEFGRRIGLTMICSRVPTSRSRTISAISFFAIPNQIQHKRAK